MTAARTAAPLDAAPELAQQAGAVVQRAGAREALATAGVFVLGLLVRAWIVSDPRLGHDSDLGFFTDWMRELSARGLRSFYETNSFCDYPPLMILLFQSLGHVTRAFLPAPLSDDYQLVLKVAACAADLLIGGLLLAEGRRLLGRAAGLLACGLFVLNPVVIYNSAYWGQVDSIYTALLVAALVLASRRLWLLAGLSAGAALLAKFQSIALLPLLGLEAYRLHGFRGVGAKLIGIGTSATILLAPLAAHGVLRESLMRSYVHVVGQYNELSKSAFNLWWLGGSPEAADTGVPEPILRLAAGGAVELPEGASPLLLLTWRNLSLLVYALAVAVVLSLYSLRPAALARYAAGGALGLAFYLFPTEMHERYAFPALAFLAVWASAGRTHERLYLAISAMLLLNLASVLPPMPLGPQIAGLNLLLFATLLAALWLPRVVPANPPPMATRDVTTPLEDPLPPRRALLSLFRGTTAAALAAATVGGGWLTWKAAATPAPPPTLDALYLSDLPALSARQGWKSLQRDRSVSGATLRISGRLYLKGLGTHAPARLEFAVPEGVREFRTFAGIDGAARRSGSATVTVELDGVPAGPPLRIDGGAAPQAIALPVTGVRRVALIAEDAGDGRRGDHVDWALARFVVPSCPDDIAAQ